MAHGGEALGRSGGKVVFVDGGLPGEQVQAAVYEERPHYARARLVQVLRPSPDRIDVPRCPHFGDPLERFSPDGVALATRFCGGCQWQHIAYAAQLRYKREILVDQLRRIGKVEEPPVQPTIGMREPWGYRNHAQFRIVEDGRLGFIGIDGRSVVGIDVCHIIHPLLQELLEALELDFPALERVALRAGIRTGDQMVVLETTADEPPAVEIDITCSCVLLLSDGVAVALAGRTYIVEELAGRRFRISAGSFFQANTEMAEVLVETVRRYLAPTGSETLLDAYCGVGTFGLCLVNDVRQVVGIEANPIALDDALENTAEGENAVFYEGTVGAALPVIEEEIDIAVLDPPRQGLEPEALEALVDRAPSRIAYVSCDPATLARDVRRFREAGYELVEVQPVDMFPQTYHIEAVALLVR